MPFPQWWRTADGGTLVERAEGSFVRFDRSGAVAEVYGAWPATDSDGIASVDHAVEGSVLVAYHEADGGGCTRSSYALVRDLEVMRRDDCAAPLADIDERVARFRQRRHRR
jgi:hypothetical protein